MAAILCKGFGDCLACPFNLCGSCCRGICNGCSTCCKNFTCNNLCSLCKSPLSAYVMITIIFQLPIVVFSLIGLFPGIFQACLGSGWLLGILLVAIVHIGVSFYGSYRVTNSTDETLRDKHSSWERISYLLCHDPIIAIYICVYIFYVIWLIVGVVWSIFNNFDDCDGVEDNLDTFNDYAGNNDDTYNTENYIVICLVLGFLYLLIGPCVLSCILCCTCFSSKDYAADDAAFEALKVNENANANANGQAQQPTDIESPLPNPQSQPETKSTKTDGPPRTYSADGVPIDEVNTKNGDNSKSGSTYSDITEVIPEVVAEEIITPPQIHQQEKPKASAPSETETMTAPSSQSQSRPSAVEKASKQVESVANDAMKTVSGWFSTATGSKKNNDNSNSTELPETKATVY